MLWGDNFCSQNTENGENNTDSYYYLCCCQAEWDCNKKSSKNPTNHKTSRTPFGFKVL